MAFAESERPPEERPDPAEVAPKDEPVTAHPDPAEPAGEDEAGNEAEIEEATERSEGMEGSSGQSPVASRQEEVERQRDEYLALAQRTQADFENFRKRAARETAAAGERARGTLVRELLPVLDNLERALASAEEREQHLAEGVKLVHADLLSVLQRNGVEQFDPSGEKFDPTFHEALSTREEIGRAHV